MKIILDTNFLIYSAKNKLDYVEEIADLINEGYGLVVPRQVINELEKLRDDKLKKVSGKDKAAADLALKLLEHNGVKIINLSGKNVDEAIIALSETDPKNIVCTLDRGMRLKLPRVILVNRLKKLMLTK
jgi:rRNA-processing protein FCF1